MTKSRGRISIALAIPVCIVGLSGVTNSAWAACAPITSVSTTTAAGGAPQPTPEERMQRRFPQPVLVRDLIGLPVYDDKDRTLGRIQEVVRTDADKICLVVPFGGWFGWGDRLVAVPLETAVILGKHVNAVDFSRSDFEAAPTWTPGTDVAIAADQSIRIGLGRR